jgi:hypothetical protein
VVRSVADVSSDDWSDSDDDLDDHDDLDDLRAFGAAGDLDELDRWLAESRVDAAVTSRRKERWLAQQAGEEASVAGVLRDLGERGTTVVVSTVAERRHRGRVRAVGDDFAILDTEQGEVVVRLAAVSAVRVPGDGAVTGDRADRLTVTLADVLPTMAADRPRVTAVTRSGEQVHGELRSAGRDVAMLRLDGSPSDLAYLPLGSVAELVLR